MNTSFKRDNQLKAGLPSPMSEENEEFPRMEQEDEETNQELMDYSLEKKLKISCDIETNEMWNFRLCSQHSSSWLESKCETYLEFN